MVGKTFSCVKYFLLQKLSQVFPNDTIITVGLEETDFANPMNNQNVMNHVDTCDVEGDKNDCYDVKNETTDEYDVMDKNSTNCDVKLNNFETNDVRENGINRRRSSDATYGYLNTRF